MNEQNNNEEDIPSEVKAKLSSIKPKFQKGAERSSSKARNIVQDAQDAAKGKVDSAEGRTGEEIDNEVRTSGDLDQSRDEEQKTEGQVKDELDRKDQQNSKPEKNESGDADAEAYEVNPDEMLSKAEKKAEKEFQANGT